MAALDMDMVWDDVTALLVKGQGGIFKKAESGKVNFVCVVRNGFWTFRTAKITEWEALEMGTAVVLVVLISIVALVIRSMVRDKKAGKSLQCGGNCSACMGCNSHAASDTRAACMGCNSHAASDTRAACMGCNGKADAKGEKMTSVSGQEKARA